MIVLLKRDAALAAIRSLHWGFQYWPSTVRQPRQLHGQSRDRSEAALEHAYARGADTLTTVNTWNDSSAVSQLAGISKKSKADLARIAEAPGIQRIVAKVNGKVGTYYILPATPHGFAASEMLVAYGSGLGQLAVIDVGEEDVLELDSGDKQVLVIERAKFTPRTSHKKWDGTDAVIETESFGPITVRSLQALFDVVPVETADSVLIDAVIAAEAAAQNVFEGLRRSTLERMSLRELSTLDRYQDAIFRLPLSRRLLILGRPAPAKRQLWSSASVRSSILRYSLPMKRGS